MDNIVCTVPLLGQKKISEWEWRNCLGCDMMLLDLSCSAPSEGATIQSIDPSRQQYQESINKLQGLQPADVIFSRPIEMISADGCDFKERLRRMAESPLNTTELFCTVALPATVACATHGVPLLADVGIVVTAAIVGKIYQICNPSDVVTSKSLADLETQIKNLDRKNTKQLDDINTELIRIVSAEVKKINDVAPDTSKQDMVRRFKFACEVIEVADHIHDLVGDFLPPKLQTITKKAITTGGLIVQTGMSILDVNPLNPMSYVKAIVNFCRCGKSTICLIRNDSNIDPADALRAELRPIFDAIEKQNQSMVDHLNHIDGVLRTMQAGLETEFAQVYDAMRKNFLALSISLEDLSQQHRYVDSMVRTMIKSKQREMLVQYQVMYDEMVFGCDKTDSHMDKFVKLAANFPCRLKGEVGKTDVGANLYPLEEAIGLCIGTLTVKLEQLAGIVLEGNPISGEMWALLCKNLIEYLIQLRIVHPEPPAQHSPRRIRRTLEVLIGMGQEHIKFIRNIRDPAVLRAVVNEYEMKLNKVLSITSVQANLNQNWRELQEGELLLRRYLDASLEGLSSTAIAVICRPPFLFRSTLELQNAADRSVALRPQLHQYNLSRMLQEQSDTLRLLVRTLSTLHEFCNDSPLQFINETEQMLNALMSMHVSYSDKDQISYRDHFTAVRANSTILPVPSYTLKLSEHKDFRLAMKLSALDDLTQQSLISTLDSYVNQDAAFHSCLDELGRNSFLVACASGCSYTISHLLKCSEKGAMNTALVQQHNTRDVQGNSALHLSAQSGNVVALNILIQHYGYGAFYGSNLNSDSKRPCHLLPEYCRSQLPVHVHLVEAQTAEIAAKSLLLQAESAQKDLQIADDKCKTETEEVHKNWKIAYAVVDKLHPHRNVASKNTIRQGKLDKLRKDGAAVQEAIDKRRSSVHTQLRSASLKYEERLLVHSNALDCVNSIMAMLPESK